MPDNPHFSFPFSVDGSSVAVDEQDSQEEILSCVNVIVRCPVGFRVERPDFGIPDPTFRATPVNYDEIQDAVETFEPRAELDITEYPDIVDASLRHLEIDVSS